MFPEDGVKGAGGVSLGGGGGAESSRVLRRRYSSRSVDPSSTGSTPWGIELDPSTIGAELTVVIVDAATPLEESRASVKRSMGEVVVMLVVWSAVVDSLVVDGV